MKFLLSPEARVLFLLFLIWKLLLLIDTAIAPLFIPSFNHSFPYLSDAILSWGLPDIIWPWANFDGAHYIRIARDGYSQYTQAFFPLYPILIRILSPFVFDNYLITGLLISNFSFLVSIFVFYNLVKLHFSKSIAYWSSVFLIFSPTSFYFGALYTESLFLLLTVSSFYLLAKNKIFLASTIGMFAATLRLVGIFLSISLVKKKHLLPIIIVPIGLLLYMVYLKLTTNDPFAFISSQNAFAQNRTTAHPIFLPQVLYRYSKIILTTSGASLFNALLELFSLIVALFLLLRLIKKIPAQWLIFSILSIIIPTFTGTLISMPRYVLVAFPIYLSLGLIKSKPLKITLFSISTCLLLFLAALFTRGYWVA